MEGIAWNHESQIGYQIRLIRERLYGFGQHQFYAGLTSEQIKTLEANPDLPISYDDAQELFDTKSYRDPPMRGRQSINPLTKFGFAIADAGRPIEITDVGKHFLEDNYDLEDIFLRVLLKWQIPNPDNRRFFNPEVDYNVKPFVGTLHLIQRVNSLEVERGRDPKGISKQEFCLFVPTLVHYRDIEKYAQLIIDLRIELARLPAAERQQHFEFRRRELLADLLKWNDNGNLTNTEKKRIAKNLLDYGDNAIRYFRLTSYIHIRGGGFYIDLEPRRHVEITKLLAGDDGAIRQFGSREEFLSYITDFMQPTLPWDKHDALLRIIDGLRGEIHEYESKLGRTLTEVVDIRSRNVEDLRELVTRLRTLVRELRQDEQYRSAQLPDSIVSYIDTLQNIFRREDRALLLEEVVGHGLSALNDANSISPNYPVGDDNKPTHTAPANVPDIECYYDSFNATCEVTMLTTRNQWYYEGQPVSRHLRDFEDKNPDKPAYCVFIAPKLHRDTVNTFWQNIQLGYEGKPSRIIPLSIHQFAELLRCIHQLRRDDIFFSHLSLQDLFDRIVRLGKDSDGSVEWLNAIPCTITSWRSELVNESSG